MKDKIKDDLIINYIEGVIDDSNIIEAGEGYIIYKDIFGINRKMYNDNNTITIK